MHQNLVPYIENVGTAIPEFKFTQNDVLKYFREENTKNINIFENSHIEKRHFVVPLGSENNNYSPKNRASLTTEHLLGSILLAKQSISKCMSKSNFSIDDVDQIVCVSSTGFLTPGLSAYIIRELNLKNNINKVDIVGMGCNAGMNGLQVSNNFVSMKPNRISLLVCVEICSATRFYDGSVPNAVVNSLFADGSATMLVSSHEMQKTNQHPRIVDFETLNLVQYIDDMRFLEFGDALTFYLSKEIPFVIGENIIQPVLNLLERNNLHKNDISYWVLHGGGKKVIDAIQQKLNLPDSAFVDTRKVLREYGNLSSCSYIFAYEKLLCRINKFKQGDKALVIAMGPGTTIEVGLLRWDEA